MCMYKKCVCLISIVLLLGIVGNASAADVQWNNASGDRLWRNSANWSGGAVPTLADKAAIRDASVSGPIIDGSTTAQANQIVLGDWGSTSDTLDMTGGSLTTNAWFILGYGSNNNGTFTMSAGTVNVGSDLYVGFMGTGTIDITGGSITVTGTFGIAQSGGAGDAFLDGGTISSGAFSMATGAAMDITAGTLIVNGDVTSTINGYISNGWITAYNGTGTVNVDYDVTNPGKTTVTGESATPPPLPGQATNPSPSDGATGISTLTDLTWTAGSDATSHDVYFGTTSPGTFQGNQTTTTFDPGTMATNTTYYWRIDEVNASGTTTGVVWSFTTIVAGLSDTTDDGTGTISARGENLPDEGMAKLFDNLTSTKWLDFSPTYSWIQYQYATDKRSVVTEYTLTSANDYPARDPMDWNILGSNDGGSTWDTLDTRTGELFTARFQTRSFQFTNSTAYNIYRLEITQVMDGATANSVQLAEIELIGTPPAPPGPPGQATNPSPADGATDVSTTADLSWTAGSGATSHDVYFGTTSPGTFQGNQTSTTFNPGTMADSTTYYWRIDEVNASGTTTGVVWSFTTAAPPPPPGQATNPSPANAATDVSTIADLSWTAGSGATSHDVYFGTDSTPDSTEFQGNQTPTTFNPGTMAYSTTYYWRIDEVNASGTTTGTVWSFTTAASPPPPGQATNPSPADGATDVSTTATLSWTAGSGATSHDVYFGTTSPGTFQGNQTPTTFDTGTMANDTTYYWRIDEVNAYGTTTGVVWSFTTIVAGLSDTTDDGTGTISARGENLPNEGMAEAFDNSTSTKWLDFSPTYSWIQYQYASSNKSVVTEYTLTSANDAIERDPMDWNILGSNDGGSTWDTLDTRTGELFTARFQTRSFQFTNSTAYNIYRLEITQVRDLATANSTQLAEIELIGTPPAPPGPPGQATNPSPADGATSVSTTANLSWTAGTDAASHDVYFGTDSTPDSTEFQGNQTPTTFDPGTLASSTTYYWRIDEVNAAGTTTGVVWSFTTAAPSAPGQATNPSPANGATNVGVVANLSWTAGSGADSHDVYFGTTSPGTFQGNQTATTFDPGTMAYSTTYYWRIDEKNAVGTTTGVVWSFTTEPSAPGVDREWYNTTGDRLWRTAGNWSGTTVPSSADKAAIRNSGPGPIIDSSTSAVANYVVLSDWSSTGDTLDMTGGTLSTAAWFVVGYQPANNGTFTMSGGAADVGTYLYVGNMGTGTLQITGGTINVVTTFGIAQAGGVGDVFLDGGTISAGALNMTSSGWMDITEGTLIVNGDVTSTINSYISSGWITGYGGIGTMSVDYDVTNPGKTTVTSAITVPPQKATGPNPANGAGGVSIVTALSWTAGAAATSHDVYFGTDATPDSTEFKGNQTTTTFDPGTLAYTTTYYWRIDEKNSIGTTTGDVWSFTTSPEVTANFRKGPYLIYPGNNTQMQVLWQLDAVTVSNIAWGTDTSYSTGNANTSQYGDNQHSYTIGSLTPGTKYYYRVTAGASQYTGDFTAAPSTSATNVKFLMYGDTRTNPGDHDSVASRMIATYNADPACQTMLLLSGDWVESNSESDWTNQFFNYGYGNIMQNLRRIPIQGCMGNHEGGGSVYVKYYPYPYVGNRYWSFDYGPVHIVILDQYVSYSPGSAQHNWLVSDLSGSTKTWKVIVLHQPGWSAGSHGNDGNVQNYIQPLCTQYGVQMVVGGHNHYYARAVVSGVQHITSGGGGAPLYSTSSGEYIVVRETTLNFQKVEISGNSLTCTAYRPNGTVIDAFTISP